MASTVGAQAAKDRARQRLKDAKWKEKKMRIEPYPSCISSGQGCPPSIPEPNNPPSQCKFCPMYMDSKFCVKDEQKEKERAKELAGLFKHFGKPKES